jgi:mRNA interferase RelE/StbE
VLSLPKEVRLEVARAIDQLADTPRPFGCKKLRGTDLWQLRLGRYRVVYAIDDEARLITILKVALRREDTYQGL